MNQPKPSPSKIPGKSAQRYVHYLKAVQSQAKLKLRPADERLLNVLAVLWLESSDVTVDTIIASSTESLMTTHRLLRSLRRQGLIDVVFSKKNVRLRYIVPTTLVQEHFEYQGECFVSQLAA